MVKDVQGRAIIGSVYNNQSPDLILHLSMPPSINQAYSNTKNPKNPRIKSQKYNKWIQDATKDLWLQKRALVTGRIAVIYSFYVPDRRVRDCANYEKCLSDFLVQNNIIEDDKNIRSNTQEWLDNEPTNSGVIAKIFKLFENS